MGSMTVTSAGVDITIVGKADMTTQMLMFCGTTYYYLSLLYAGKPTQLYFTWRGNRYEPGDSILITDVGVHHSNAGPGDSLVCVTTDVNTQCCTDQGKGSGSSLMGAWSFVIYILVVGLQLFILMKFV